LRVLFLLSALSFSLLAFSLNDSSVEK
jgi:hypothetical protein